MIVPSAPTLPLGRNRLLDPRLTTLALNPRGATVTDTHPTTDGPDGGSFYRRHLDTGNTSSPMNGAVTGTGTAGVPVAPGQEVTPSCYRRRQPPNGGTAFRFDIQWFTPAGATISTSNGVLVPAPTSWDRHAETFVAPAGAAYASLGLTFSGLYAAGTDLDLAMAQFEYGDTATEWVDGASLNPILVLDYAYTRGSRNVVLEPLGSSDPTVFLRPARSRAGTLSLLFGSAFAAREAVKTLSAADRFSFSEPAVGEAWDFIVTGDVTNTKVTGVDYWTVDAEVREVTQL